MDRDRKVKVFLDGSAVSTSLAQSQYSKYINFIGTRFTVVENPTLKTYDIALKYADKIIPKEGGTLKGTIPGYLDFDANHFDVSAIATDTYTVTSTGRVKVNAIATIRPLKINSNGVFVTENAGTDTIDITVLDATTSVRGVVLYSANRGTTALTAVSADDSRLLPITSSGGTGLAPATNGVATNYLDGTGNWHALPAAGTDELVKVLLAGAAVGGGTARKINFASNAVFIAEDAGNNYYTVTVLDASTSQRGVTLLAADRGTTAGTVVQANDGRLSVATTSNTGLLPARSGSATTYLDGTGAWSTPTGSGGGSTSGVLTQWGTLTWNSLDPMAAGNEDMMGDGLLKRIPRDQANGTGDINIGSDSDGSYLELLTPAAANGRIGYSTNGPFAWIDQGPHLYGKLKLTALGNKRLFVGFSGGPLAADTDSFLSALSGFGIRLIATNWEVYTNDGAGSGTGISVGAAAANTAITYHIWWDTSAGNIKYSINGGSTSTISSDLPASIGMRFSVRIQTTNSTEKGMYSYYQSVSMT